MSISKTRQKLITVARELFAKQGFDGITMNDIAQASQKGRRTMYTYFSSKEDIYYAVIEDELEHLSEEMDKVVNLPIDPQEKIVKKTTTKKTTKAKDQKIVEMNSMQSVTADQIADGATYLGIMEANLKAQEAALK